MTIEALLGHYRVLVVIHGQALAVARVLHLLPCGRPSNVRATINPGLRSQHPDDGHLGTYARFEVVSRTSHAGGLWSIKSSSKRRARGRGIGGYCRLRYGSACGSLEGYGPRRMATETSSLKSDSNTCAITEMSQFLRYWRFADRYRLPTVLGDPVGTVASSWSGPRKS